MGGLVKYSRPQKVTRDIDRLTRLKSKPQQSNAPMILLIVFGVIVGALAAEFAMGNLSISDVQEQLALMTTDMW